MQIRVANRQDESLIRAVIFQYLEESAIQPDLEGRDRDLRNVERNYFWYDGLCIVAENNGQIIGVLAARRHEGQEEILDLARLALAPDARKHGAAEALIKTMLYFAKNMEYKTIVCSLAGRAEAIKPADREILQRLGFGQDNSGLWQISISSPTKAALR